MVTFFAFAAAFLTACGGPAANAPANNAGGNANANAAKPVAAAPTADALLALDKQANEAYFKGDSKFFEGMLHESFVMYDGGQRVGKADTTKMIAGNKCDVKDGWKLEEPQMASINADTYVLSYKGTFDGTCTGPDGKSMKIPSPVRAASVFVRNGDKWQGVFHGETMIIDPKNPPAAQPSAPAAQPDAAKKDANSNSSANAAAPAKPSPGANTDALVKIHTSGWEAWKAKDARKLEEISSANLSIVDPMGIWTSGRAAVVKLWTDMKCEGVNSVKVTDGFASAVSPTVEILTLKGTADGTCDGQKNGPLFQSAVYVKEGDAWKLAFMFESPGA